MRSSRLYALFAMLWFGVALPWAIARPSHAKGYLVVPAVTLLALVAEFAFRTRRGWWPVLLGAIVFVIAHLLHLGWVARWGPVWISNVAMGVQRDLGRPMVLVAYISGFALMSLQTSMVWTQGVDTLLSDNDEEVAPRVLSSIGLLMGCIFWACALRWLSLGATGVAWW